MRHTFPLLAFLLFTLSTQNLIAQDLLKLKNGDELKVKVQEITPQEVKYKRFDNLNGPIITILKNTVQAINYENGTTEPLTDDVPPTPHFQETILPVQPVGQNYADIYQKGQMDAKRYYDGYKGAGTGTFITTLLVGPILGLIPAIACSSTPPKEERLGFPNNQLSQDPNYYSGYTKEARHIKSRKVWGNFGIATGIVFLVAIVASSAR